MNAQLLALSDNQQKRIAELEKERDEILNSALDSESNYCKLKDSLPAHNLEQQANGCFEAISEINSQFVNGASFVLVRDVNNFGVKKQLQAKALKETV